MFGHGPATRGLFIRGLTMPTRENSCLYAMYVIGQVESNHNWAAVNRNDPITLGMMQWYGQRAALLIQKCADKDPTGYEQFKTAASKLAAAVEANHGWDWWTSYYVNDEEALAWAAWAERDENHVAQQEQWFENYSGYVDTLSAWGLSEERPQVLIYAMSMYHQSPAQCGKVIASCGGMATLATMHATCLNDGVLGIYKNRYNTVYQLLNDWDGESAPPDFGQVDTPITGGDSEPIERPSAPISYVMQRDGLMYVMGMDGYPNGVVCYKSGPNIWTPGLDTAGGEENPGTTTGGGDDTGGDAADRVCQWMIDHEGQFAYSNGPGRLDPPASGVGDCSSTCWYAYHVITGIDVGNHTTVMMNKGKLIESGDGRSYPSDLRKGDLILFAWYDYTWRFDHVEMYIGDGKLSGHGGPGNGPTTKNARNYIMQWPLVAKWEVRRYL